MLIYGKQKKSSCDRKPTGDTEDFQIGAAPTFFARELFFSARPTFPLFGMALRISCGVKKIEV